MRGSYHNGLPAFRHRPAVNRVDHRLLNSKRRRSAYNLCQATTASEALLARHGGGLSSSRGEAAAGTAVLGDTGVTLVT